MQVDRITPLEFELEVRRLLQAAAGSLKSFSADHRPVISGVDGDYEIDVAITFEAVGVNFLVLVECKKTSRPIEREVIQVLHDRVRSTGAHKGIVFSSQPYQRGAINYAQRHGIAFAEKSCAASFARVSMAFTSCATRM